MVVALTFTRCFARQGEKQNTPLSAGLVTVAPPAVVVEVDRRVRRVFRPAFNMALAPDDSAPADPGADMAMVRNWLAVSVRNHPRAHRWEALRPIGGWSGFAFDLRPRRSQSARARTLGAVGGALVDRMRLPRHGGHSGNLGYRQSALRDLSTGRTVAWIIEAADRSKLLKHTAVGAMIVIEWHRRSPAWFDHGPTPGGP